ncbi:hypothetical protein TIFTF001_022869 [Ficus carica]|uniref:F-box associated beta-propeller type 1 domain-containing protein n=1 Tax=Ficus carica TaxID=3494 RepID=A0AA88DK28_FICCA|nr:hypothetical protein TIFTF001_022869 [Ficus carica]
MLYSSTMTIEIQLVCTRSTSSLSRCSARFGNDKVVETFPHWYLRLEGSDNGVLCLAEGENCVFLWNRETTELKALPSPPVCHWQIPIYLHGLGYDSLRVISKCLRRNSWKIMEMPEILSSALASKHFSSCVRSNDRRSVIVNRSIHWMLYLEGGNEGQDSELMIVAFDLSTEVFKLIDPPRQLLNNRPPLLGEDDGYSYSIDKFSECLSMVFAMEIQKSYFEIWVMEKYGVSKSWTRRVKVDLEGVHHPLDTLKVKDRRKSFSLRPVLIQFRTILIWYDLESHKLRDITFKDEEAFAFTTYTESLIHI